MGILDQMQGGQGVDVTNFSTKQNLTLAKVTSIDDPAGLNRVKCKPLMNDDDVKDSNWAYVCSFMSGNNTGAFFHPNQHDIVLLGYLDGNAHTPIVLGRLWVNQNKPPYKIQGVKNDVYSIKMKSGAEILIDETSGKEKISVTTKGGTTLLLDDGGKTIAMKDRNNTNALSMDLNKGEVTLKAGKKITMQAGTAAKLILDGTASKATLQGQTNVTIKGAQVKVDATGDCTIKANGKASLQSSAATIVKGSIVKIN